ncbi:serpin family protein [Streptomyces sporangiiformans]|uniref:Serpin family protein n=1 Tax=Streptomyces sporangiiformans TaxID=2315329 RepID=A0A505DLS6_9ACTN|nr:serpin family protein [Streptomyces sporangiiformans]TPQ21416.1 serpin family protein [Streptomyces sporangiiformans]
MQVTNRAIRAVNELTTRWAGASAGGTAFSAAGVWPLLALLTDGAAGPARAELAEAVDLPAGEAAAAGRELLSAMAGMRGLDSAVGLWTKRTLELREEWEAGLPTAVHGVLTGREETDREALDAWAAKRTGGLIERMPVPLTDRTEMVLASALALRTEWFRPFKEYPVRPRSGPWQKRTLRGLRRSTRLLDRVGVADTPYGAVTELKVLGNTGIDVHLLLGEERMSPGQVLGAGVDVLGRRHAVVPGHELPYGEAGPGLRVEKERCVTPQPPSLDVTTVAFDLSADHDLLHLHGLFGLTTARDESRGHFPGISAQPLCVGSAQQSTTATFGALGFRAASVTALAAAPGGGIPELRYTTTTIDATFDRPFGFLALNRSSRLVLAAGWVTDPTPYREDEDRSPSRT